MPYFVYIVECRDKTFYIGYTTNVEKRILAHNGAKMGARYTRSRRPVALKHTEKFRTLSAALKREAALKKLSRRQKIELMEKRDRRVYN